MDALPRRERRAEEVLDIVAQLRETRTSGRRHEGSSDGRATIDQRGWWEMTWAPNGRALFTYGPEVRPGEQHVIWQRIGGHEIFE